MRNINDKNILEEISKIRSLAKTEKVSMIFVLNVKNYLEQKRMNDLFVDANVIVQGYPSALEKIAINLDKL